jgi:hypothetical protein
MKFPQFSSQGARFLCWTIWMIQMLQARAAGPDLIIWPDELNATLVNRSFSSNQCDVIEGCALPGARRYLVFGTETRNIGDADLVVGDPRFNTNFTFVTCHGHYHFDGFADYRLVGSAGLGAARGNKVGFCLRDSVPWRTGAPSLGRYNCDFQGIQSGWSDVYGPTLSCQWVDVTDVPAGLYVLEVEVNPEGRLPETSRSNNLTRVSVVISDPCSGPPANDGFNSPIVIGRRIESVFASTACATKEAGEPNHTGRNVTNTIWFRWTAPYTGNAIITTEGSTFNTLLAVYRGAGFGALNSVASSNDDGQKQTSRVSFNATSNTVYQIAVAGLANAPGGVALHINPGRNDRLADAETLTGRSGRLAGMNTAATRTAGEPEHAGISGTNSVWFSWTADTNGLVQLDTGGSNFDTLLAVYTGTQESGLTPVASDDNSGPDRTSRLAFAATPGMVYRIAVDAAGGASGFFWLNWGPVLAPRIQAITALATGGVQLTLTGNPGESYQLQSSGNLTAWTNWTLITNLNGTIEVVAPGTNGLGVGQQFFRALVEP